MSELIALAVAILPPRAIHSQALSLSAGLAAGDHARGLVLDEGHLPHITLTQQFIRDEEQVPVFERIDETLRTQPPLHLMIRGSEKRGRSIWMTIERTSALVGLHERLMEALRGFERSGGTGAAFFDGDARMGDVIWVAGYRLKSSFGAFSPHITLGAADLPVPVDPTSFAATTVAACHLGRFCSCRAVLRSWELG